MIALSRTCRLQDFADCDSVAEWQQRLGLMAWRAWLAQTLVQQRGPVLCVNWSGVPFNVPGTMPVYQHRGDKVPKLPTKMPAIYALKVLDHVEAPVRFLTDAVARLQPTGLLFLTYSFWDAEGPDEATGNGARKRIYDVTSEQKLLVDARRLGLQPLGAIDWDYHGDTLDDHTLASLVLVRR